MCTNCELEFSFPMTTPGSDWYDAAYIIRHSIVDTSIRNYYKWAISLFTPDGTLLDIGCGEGVFVNYAIKNGFHAFGTDFSQDSIDAGRRLFGLETTYRCSPKEISTLTNILQFDAVTAFEVIEHLDRPKDFLAEVYPLLKQDGRIAVSVPNRDKWPFTEFNDYPPHHLTRWTERSLRTFFSSNHFEVIAVRLGSRFHSYRMFLGYLFRIVLYRIMGMYRKGLTLDEPKVRTANILKNEGVRSVLSFVKLRLVRDVLFFPIALLTFPIAFPWFKGANLMLLAKKGDKAAASSPPSVLQNTTWSYIDRSLNYGRHLIRDFLTHAGPYRTVLDIGAGHGDDLLLAREIAPKADINAIEVYPTYAADLAQKGIRVHSLNIENESIPFPDGSVDVIIANQVLEHVKELFWIFHEISRTLPVGGKMILGVPNLAALHNRILLAVGKQPSPLKNYSAHIRGYTKYDLLKFFDICFPGGYRLKQFGGSNFYPFPPVLAKPLARLFPNLAWGIFFLFEKQREYRGEFLEFPIREGLETNFYVGKTQS